MVLHIIVRLYWLRTTNLYTHTDKTYNSSLHQECGSIWGYISFIIMKSVVTLWEGIHLIWGWLFWGIHLIWGWLFWGRNFFLLGYIFPWGYTVLFGGGAPFSRGILFKMRSYVISERSIASTIALEGYSNHLNWGGGVFYCWKGGPFLGGIFFSWGVSASHARTCTRTESKDHVINYCAVTRSKVNDTEVTSFSVAICMKQTKILYGQLNCLVKLADVLTRCSSRPQGKSEARCEMLVLL